MRVNSKNVFSYAVLGSLYPFGGLIYSIWNFRKPASKILFYVFCLFVGYSFIYDRVEYMDAAGYAEGLAIIHKYSLSWQDAIEINGSVDFYNGTVTYLLSLFTGNPKILFLVYAAVMGFFLTQNLWFVLDRLQGKLHYSTIILLVLLGFVCPIWLINGVRMWTALHIFAYGVLHYLVDKNYKYLIWSLLSILVHFSFILPTFLLLIFIFIPAKNLKFYFYLFLVSYFIRELDFQFIRQLLSDFMPEYMQPRIGYLNDAYIEKVNERLQQSSIHITYKREAYKYIVLALSISGYFLIKKKSIVLPQWMSSFFKFSLFFYAAANVMSIAPTGHRYTYLANTFIFSFLIILSNLVKTESHLLKRVMLVLTPFILFMIIVEMRIALGYLSPMVLFGNFILASIVEINISIIEYVKDFVI